ncbi:MAG TPA: hypothetical protein VM432_00110, partial [Bdellovibrionales bacterium]|nr:hypothetical protein [Bdellovibrionales bacterium]
MPNFLKVGRNISGLYPCTRAAFLIDADRFFRALVESIVKAKRQILIAGWDIDSRTELPFPEGIDWPLTEAERDRGSVSFGRLLKLAIERKPELKIYILSWDYTFIYLFERETLSSAK